MTHRAYAMDPDGHYNDVHVLVKCTTDELALQAAAQYVNVCKVQVWDLDRLVGTLSSVEGLVVIRLGS